MSTIPTVIDAVLRGNLKEIQALTQQALDAGISPRRILDESLVRGMELVSESWKTGKLFVPEVLRSAKTMQLGMDVLKPLLVGVSFEPKATFAIGTVKGDLHDIGKNLVAMMLESCGYRVINLGTDLEAKVFVDQVQAGVQCIGISALLTTTMPQMKIIIDSIEEAGLRDKVKIFVGGAPVTQEYADEIGADFYSVDAAHAIEQMNSICA